MSCVLPQVAFSSEHSDRGRLAVVRQVPCPPCTARPRVCFIEPSRHLGLVVLVDIPCVVGLGACCHPALSLPLHLISPLCKGSFISWRLPFLCLLHEGTLLGILLDNLISPSSGNLHFQGLSALFRRSFCFLGVPIYRGLFRI